MHSIPKRNLGSQRKSESSRPIPQPVLLLAHADGWLEVFAERHIQAKIVMVPSTGSLTGELLAEQYLDATLPHRYRDLHWPGKLRAADRLRTVRPSDLMRREHDLAILQGLDGIERHFSGTNCKEAKVWML
ncbi:hypothetical protein [Aeoliella sp. SH292]|uniref:hypothetical protein n=1 Tax=Aeoliella sp. SH292 TaxID=3454464 RepID=UPI003F98A3FF